MQNKRVIITGGTGFVGLNLIRYFAEAGNEVFAFIRNSSDVSLFDDVINKISIFKGDYLEDFDLLRRTCKAISPQVFIHGAAYGTRPFRLGKPYQTDLNQMISTNIIGTKNVLNACKDLELDCLIHLGSSSEYGHYDTPMTEDGPTNPVNLYGVTKVCATQLAGVIGRECSFPVYTLRLFSIYGEFEDPTRLIPTILLGALEQKPVSLSSPDPVRDYVYVDDAATAIDFLVQKSPPSGIYNVCTGKQWSIKAAVEAVEKVVGRKLDISYGQVGLQPNEPANWVGDPSKLKSLGWEPADFYEGLRKTYDKLRNRNDQI